MNREFPALKAGAAYRSERYWCGEHATGITTTPKESHEAFFLADLACEQLDELAAAESDRPFHLRLDFWGPHQPFFPTQEFAELYDPEDIPVYGNFADALAGKPALYWQDPHDRLTDDDGPFRHAQQSRLGRMAAHHRPRLRAYYDGRCRRRLGAGQAGCIGVG